MATTGSPASSSRAELRTARSADEPGSATHDEATLLGKLVAMCSHLSALASQTTDLVPIVEFLAASIGSGVAVVDRGLEVLACARVTEPDDIFGQLRDRAGNSATHRGPAAQP
jgi:hypothetical protein